MATMVRWVPTNATRNGNNGSNGHSTHLLPVDVNETAGAYTVIATIPGVKADHINVQFHDEVLSIEAELARPEIAEGTRIHLRERAYGNFSRRIRLPQPVDADNIEAVYEDGVLTLSIPKTPEAQPRHIPVNAVPSLN